MPLVMPTVLFITLALWTEYGIKQWLESVFTGKTVGYALYAYYRICHLAVLAVLLCFVYPLQHGLPQNN